MFTGLCETQTERGCLEGGFLDQTQVVVLAIKNSPKLTG